MGRLQPLVSAAFVNRCSLHWTSSVCEDTKPQRAFYIRKLGMATASHSLCPSAHPSMWSIPGAGVDLTSHCPHHTARPRQSRNSLSICRGNIPSTPKSLPPNTNHSVISLEPDSSDLCLKRTLNMGEQNFKTKEGLFSFYNRVMFLYLKNIILISRIFQHSYPFHHT